ncbi:MAG: hypothetical protein NC115_01915 [Bacteroidales bacterium]|nr:hypothetical protein [Bacteroidales bacterium]
MDKGIVIRGCEQNNLCLFRDFVFNLDEIEHVSYILELHLGPFNVCVRLMAELSDFTYLKSGMEKMYVASVESALFEPLIDNRFRLLLELQEYGAVKVSVFFTDEYHNGKLDYKFMIDRTYLPDIISMLEDVVTNAKSLN